MILEWLGPTMCFTAADAPPLTRSAARHQAGAGLNIPAADKEKIFWSNARRLLS